MDIRVLYGTHGNELLGPSVGELLDADPIAGIQHKNAHPEVWEVGKGALRLLGDSQLQAKYPGDPQGDPEE
jgi:hypothetical protein